MIKLRSLSNTYGLIKSLDENRVRQNEPLAQHTTLGIGGPAEIFYEAYNSGELIKAVRLAHSFGIPLTILGGGSNVLISDLGIKGLVIKNKSNEVAVQGQIKRKKGENEEIEARWKGSIEGTQHYDFSDIDYSEDDRPEIEVVVDSGVNLQKLIFELIDSGITGLQWFARIPGTVGGAVYNNIHGGSHVFSELVKDVVILNSEGEVKTLSKNNLEFGYDKSIFHQTKDTIVKIKLILKKGDKNKAKFTALEWIKRKSIQPARSAGCVFKNISENERSILGYPTTAVGYIVEHILNMTGYKVGSAAISPVHHNFIVNLGGATAKDYLAVRNEIARRAVEILGLALEDEIIKLGDFNY